MIKRLVMILVAILVVAQFVQPDRSVPAHDPAKDMLAMTNAPADVKGLMVGACYDCHSYQTQYPWYSRITPVNFIMQDHIREGREVLNYSLWDRYAGTEAAGESGEETLEGEMPPNYYSLMHGHGKLDAAQRQLLAGWLNDQSGTGGEGSKLSKRREVEEDEED